MHTGDAVPSVLEKVVVNWDLEKGVMAASTDRAANKEKWIEKFSFEINFMVPWMQLDLMLFCLRCIDHIKNLAIMEFMAYVPKKSKSQSLVPGLRCSAKRRDIFEDSAKEL